MFEIPIREKFGKLFLQEGESPGKIEKAVCILKEEPQQILKKVFNYPLPQYIIPLHHYYPKLPEWYIPEMVF